MIAEQFQVNQQAVFYVPKLASREIDVAEQAHPPQITKQLKPRMFNRPDDMHVRRAMVVREDHHAPAFDVQ